MVSILITKPVQSVTISIENSEPNQKESTPAIKVEGNDTAAPVQQLVSQNWGQSTHHGAWAWK